MLAGMTGAVDARVSVTGGLAGDGARFQETLVGADCEPRKQTVAAWCELRSAFRHFRIDRITTLAATSERYPRRRADLVKAWRRETNRPE